MTPGVFTISLDFELFWGVRDHRSLADYGAPIRAVHEVIPKLLELFREFGVRATWATVGLVFCEDADDVRAHLPCRLPGYRDPRLSPYEYFNHAELTRGEPHHFGPRLIEKICKSPGQEIGTHTFSHYYCLEPGQDIGDFRADLAAAQRIANERGVQLTSLVFPRNQWNRNYLRVLSDAGIGCYRGNERHWAYDAVNAGGNVLRRRALRLADSYYDLTGPHTYSFNDLRPERGLPVNLPSSRFLRPASGPLASLEFLRIRRMERAMTDAALRGRMYHLWWHPHNFGRSTSRNLHVLRRILSHFSSLRANHSFESKNMSEAAALVRSLP